MDRVPYFYNFLTKNKGVGPYGIEVDKSKMQIGDIIQMQIEQPVYQHTAIITKIEDNLLFVSAHTYDSKNRPLSTYTYKDPIYSCAWRSKMGIKKLYLLIISI